MFLYPLFLLFVLNLFVPLAIELNYYLTGFIRFLQGLCAVRSSIVDRWMEGEEWMSLQGSAFPSSHGILSNWCPPAERGRFGALVYSGLYAGPVVGFFLAGLLANPSDASPIYYLSSKARLSLSSLVALLICFAKMPCPSLLRLGFDRFLR